MLVSLETGREGVRFPGTGVAKGCELLLGART